VKTRSRFSAIFRAAVCAPARRFSSTVSSAKIRRPSITWLMPRSTIRAGLSSCIGSPSTVIEPLVIFPSCTPSSPDNARSSVVFPAPFAPSNATIEPAGTFRLTPRSTSMTSS
jgi:hypothetical protein